MGLCAHDAAAGTRLHAFAAALVDDGLRTGGCRPVMRLECLRDEVHRQIKEPADIRLSERLDRRAREQPARKAILHVWLGLETS